MVRLRFLAATPLLALACATAWGVELKVATLAPDGSVWMEALRASAGEIAQRTEGRVTLRFYPGGTMGSESAVLRKIRVGQLHGGAFTSGTLAEVYPDMQVLSLPVLFRSYEEVDQVRRTVDGRLIAGLAGRGFQSYGLIEGGFAYLLSSKATRSFDDLKGQKAWIPEGDSIGAAILAEAGLAPIPLPVSDVLTGLQTGLVDTVAGPPIGVVALQWFTKVKYMTDLPLVYTYGSLVLSEKALERVGEADRAVLAEVLEKASSRLDHGTREDNERAREALVKQGIVVVELSPESAARWREVSARARQRLVDRGAVTAAVAAEVEGLLATLRGGQQGG